ncbi:MAG: glycosyltransferase [Actinomycetota bacterium]
MPTVSVVVNTYNRAAQVGGAIDSVLSQSGVDLELIVVDDGSTDDTPAVLAGIADPRMRGLRQSNRGLSAARNVGAHAARGEWLLFLDDDDRLCDGALKELLTATTDPSCRVVLGGVRFVDAHGQVFHERAPRSLDDALAGTFLISRRLFHDAGGYLVGIPCSHQTELFIRVRRVLRESNAVAAYVATPVVQMERRAAARRPEQSPAHTYFGARWLVARHPDRYGSGRQRAVMETLAGVNVMRIGREAEARRRFVSAIRHDPFSPRRYVRLAAAAAHPIGRRIWLRQWESAPQMLPLLDRVRRPDEDNLVLERDPAPGPDSLFTPWRYRENPPPSSDGPVSWRYGFREGSLRRQAPIYRLAARLARSRELRAIVDIGFGPGDSLDDEAAWNQLAGLEPQLVVCSNVIERVDDPRRLLSGIRHAVSDGGQALISTTDRSRVGPETAMGPPSDPGHVREWTTEEFSLLLESCGFEIRRVLHRQSSMGFLVVKATA